MSYVVVKTINGRRYRYEVESQRQGGKVRQVFRKYLGLALAESLTTTRQPDHNLEVSPESLTTTISLLEREVVGIVRVKNTAGQLIRLEDGLARALAVIKGDNVSLTTLGSKKVGGFLTKE